MYYTKCSFYWVGGKSAIGAMSVRPETEHPIPEIGVVFVRFGH